jgi:hypothetical protein
MRPWPQENAWSIPESSANVLLIKAEFIRPESRLECHFHRFSSSAQFL